MDFPELEQVYSLDSTQLDFYRTNQFIKLKAVLEPATLAFYNEQISEEVNRRNTTNIPLEERDTYGKAFLQIMNLWVDNPILRPLLFSKRLASLAAQLMEVEGVRMYHDQALFKEAGGGYTPWHADQYYWPLDSDKTITVWIPLQATPLAMGPLEFSAGSHRLQEGRTLGISTESEQLLAKKLRLNDFPQVRGAFDIGELSFHSGWIFHRAGPNTTDQTRKAMTIIYMDKNIKLKAPTNQNQIADWQTWCPGAEVGKVIDTPLNPILF